MDLEAVKDAARLVRYGFQKTKTPLKNADYAALVHRYAVDAGFAAVARAVAEGLDVRIHEVDDRAGIVLYAAREATFSASAAEYARPIDRPLHLLAHLAVATHAFPRSADLEDRNHVGRVSVHGVDQFVRSVAIELEKRCTDQGIETSPPVGRPMLEMLWHQYKRRQAEIRGSDNRKLPSSSIAVVTKTMTFLQQEGMLRKVSDDAGGTFSTTTRYQIHVRDLASNEMLADLAGMGIAEAPAEESQQVVDAQWDQDDDTLLPLMTEAGQAELFTER
jgi:hypothetical protein